MLVLITTCAVALASARIFRSSVPWSLDDWKWLIPVFGIPLASVALLQVLLVRQVMTVGRGRKSVALRAILLALELSAFALATAAVAVATYYACWRLTTTGGPPLSVLAIQLLQMACCPLGIVLSSGLLILAALLWLRIMGYELRFRS